MDYVNLTFVGGNLMAQIYKVQHKDLVGYVKAYNQLSAEAQMKWVQENVKCYCEVCQKTLADKYLVGFNPMEIPVKYYSPIHKENG